MRCGVIFARPTVNGYRISGRQPSGISPSMPKFSGLRMLDIHALALTAVARRFFTPQTDLYANSVIQPNRTPECLRRGRQRIGQPPDRQLVTRQRLAKYPTCH
jgi:hypothetical protein